MQDLYFTRSLINTYINKGALRPKMRELISTCTHRSDLGTKILLKIGFCNYTYIEINLNMEY